MASEAIYPLHCLKVMVTNSINLMNLPHGGEPKQQEIISMGKLTFSEIAQRAQTHSGQLG